MWIPGRMGCRGNVCLDGVSQMRLSSLLSYSERLLTCIQHCAWLTSVIDSHLLRDGPPNPSHSNFEPPKAASPVVRFLVGRKYGEPWQMSGIPNNRYGVSPDGLSTSDKGKCHICGLQNTLDITWKHLSICPQMGETLHLSTPRQPNSEFTSIRRTVLSNAEAEIIISGSSIQFGDENSWFPVRCDSGTEVTVSSHKHPLWRNPVEVIERRIWISSTLK